MDNILLVFLNNLVNIEEFNEIIDKFAQNNYVMYLLDNIKEDEYFSMESLAELVEFYKSQHENINKIVVLSNSRDLIFSWYRCYNSLVDDFIYFIDEDDKKYFSTIERHYKFYQNLSEFKNIETESVEDKIFLNISFSNNEIIDFLIKDNRFKYFDSLDRYDFSKEKLNKLNNLKKYLSNGYEYVFETKNNNKIETINIQNSRNLEYKIDDKFMESILDNIYMIPYITVLFYKNKELMLTNILLMIYKQLKGMDRTGQKYIFEKLYLYINSDIVDFKEKIYISSLLVMINNNDERLTEFIMKTLLEDDEHLEYHFAILYNILFYKTNDNLVIKNEIHIRTREEVRRLGEYVKEETKIKISKEQNNIDKQKIAIHYDQLLSMNHAPTILALKMAKNLKKYQNGCEVKIFIEDNFTINPNEVILPYFYSSAASLQLKEIHEEYLKDYNVEIYYSSPSSSKMQRTKEIVEEINKFNPNVIYTTSDISLAREILYPYYPIVYQTHGATNFSTLCDAYVLYGNSQKEKLLQINNCIKLVDEDTVYINEQPGFIFKQFKEDYKKSDIGLKEDSFVMVTVGNRLNSEVAVEFIDRIVSFLNEKDNAIWILVGRQKISYLIKKYNSLISKKKIINMDFEEDLLALYNICDVYLNPIRDGGAGSVSIAMQKGIPSIVENSSQDSVFIIGKENCVENDNVAYMYELEKLYSDVAYRKYKGKLMEDIIGNKTSWKNHIEKHLDIFNIAKQHYNERK